MLRTVDTMVTERGSKRAKERERRRERCGAVTSQSYRERGKKVEGDTTSAPTQLTCLLQQLGDHNTTQSTISNLTDIQPPHGY